MVRIIAGGEGFSSYTNNAFVDRYVKIAFPQPGVTYPEPLDLWTVRETMPREQWPYTRTYTVRWVDEAARELAIDFVTGPGGGYNPDPAADWHLFVGDEAALPAIAAAIESLPAGALGKAYLEVDSEADVQAVGAPAGVELNWLLRRGVPAGSSELLIDAVRNGEWLDGRVQVFAHGERGYMKALRDVFFVQRGLERSQVSLSGYWAKGRVEDDFQAEKQLPIGKI
jgi:NADPH-dependent ferric siderophore reductase